MQGQTHPSSLSSHLCHCQGPSPGMLWHTDTATATTSTGRDPIKHSACSQVLWRNKLSSRGQQPQETPKQPPLKEPSLQSDKAQGSPCPSPQDM